jgi:large subunit ribosomal protein L24
MMNFKTGDKVIVIAGKDKDKTGKINKILRNENKVIVEGINIVKRHQKPSQNNQSGGIIEREAPIHISNIMLVDPKSGKSTRVGHNIDKKGNKVRISKKSNETIA